MCTAPCREICLVILISFIFSISFNTKITVFIVSQTLYFAILFYFFHIIVFYPFSKTSVLSYNILKTNRGVVMFVVMQQVVLLVLFGVAGYFLCKTGKIK